MSIEVRPFGVRCNIRCHYCYQNPERDAGNELNAYDMDKIMSALQRERRDFTLFGGEPLMMPYHDLEALWSYGLQQHGKNGIQTNGTLIDERHIKLFKRYKVGVGLSVDGPEDLNDVRWAGDLQRTRDATAKTHLAIQRLCEEKIPPSLIITLHRGNATADKLPRMHDWVRELEQKGIKSARLHLLEVEDEFTQNSLALTSAENLEAMLSFLKLEKELKTLRFDVFDDMRRMLKGADRNTTCIWNACDPYTTKAVHGLEGNGQKSNCGRTNKDGIDFVKADTEGFERYIALYQTPLENGGCQGCRFFLMCKGQCPGTSIHRDWRNRTEHCEVWKGLLRHLEDELLDKGVTPLSVRPERVEVEQTILKAWGQGRNLSISDALEWLKKQRSQPAQRSNGQSGNGKSASQTAPAKAAPIRAEDGPYGLRLLRGLQMPEFTRLSWVSDGARRTWEPRIARIMQAWSQIEWLAVLEEQRRCGVTSIAPERLPAMASAVAARGLNALPISIEGASHYSYSNVSSKPLHGKPFVYRVVVGTPTDVAEFKQVWEAADQHRIGALLGYPACCREFFHELWVQHGLRDTTWGMAYNSNAPAAGGRAIELQGPPEANILWRWMGVRAVSHLPCRSDCEESAEIGRRNIDVGRRNGFGEEMDWLLEILSWPVQWSGSHGIAEIKTPILKVSATTDPTAVRYDVRRLGATYPTEGAHGLHFPFRDEDRCCSTGGCGDSSPAVVELQTWST